MRAQHEQQQAAATAAQDAALAPARRLAAALVLRGYRLTSPQVRVGSRRPYVSAQDGSVHWPVLLMYPETGQQDVIEDADEDDLIADHLDVVRAAAAAGAWCFAGACCCRGMLLLLCCRFLRHA